VSAQTPPFAFINSSVPRFHAGRDDFMKILNAHGIYSEVHTLADSPHSFWLVHPWFEPTLEYTLQFLGKIFPTESRAVAIDTIAERMLVYQRACGGWPKSYFTKDRKEVRVNYFKALTQGSFDEIRADSLKVDATYDNYATSKEINYLIKAFQKTGNPTYLEAVEKGVRYILDGQYKDTGGWPQFYPLRKGYYSHITYNDNAMVNNLNILYDIVHRMNGFEAVNPSLIKPSKEAVHKGIQCILKTQIKKDRQLMVWCAQHDEHTLEPAKARSYELPSYSGQESVGIVRFLMRIEKPSGKIEKAINSAIKWFEQTKIEGYSYVFIDDPNYTPRGVDRVFVKKEGAVSWGRFYDLDTNEPFFCSRDGVKKKTVAEIEQERRVGYGWYGDWAEDLLKKDYPKWLKVNE
jgi:PelA/Pel-15E family pectate lyase